MGSGLLLSSLSAQPSLPVRLEIKTPQLILSGVNVSISVVAKDSAGKVLSDFSSPAVYSGFVQNVPGEKPSEEIRFVRGTLLLEDAIFSSAGSNEITIEAGGSKVSTTVRVVPGWLSILPPLVAILLALILRQVVISLFAGIWVGATIVFDYDVLGGIFRVLDHYVVKGLSDTSHVQIILFSLMFGGMVGVISKNGGTIGIANVITKFARTARGGQLATWFMAFVMFFDDYANVLVRGNLMRPITDKLRVSREKLSFIVDAGAATVASVFIISTWLGVPADNPVPILSDLHAHPGFFDRIS